MTNNQNVIRYTKDHWIAALSIFGHWVFYNRTDTPLKMLLLFIRNCKTR